MKIDKRPYDSPARARQAQVTRREIVTAATELFVTRGYGQTSVAAVAERAGVSAQTVYNAVGTKRELLKAAYDVTLMGDDDPVPLADRPAARQLAELTDPRELLQAYASLGRELLERIGPLMAQIAAGAAAGDPDLVEQQRVGDSERLRGVGMLVGRLVELGALAPGLSRDRAVDRIWTLNSVQVWQLLTAARGWSSEEYANWIGEAMCAAVLPPLTPAPGPGPTRPSRAARSTSTEG